MPRFNQEEEDRMEAAQRAIAERDGLTTSQAAAEFNVNSKKLRRRLNGVKTLKNNGGHNKTLNPEQTKALCTFLDRQIANGIPMTRDMIATAAQRLLTVAGSTHKLGKGWSTRWIKYHPQYNAPTRFGPPPKVPDVFDHLENLIKDQSTDESSVLDVLTALGTPIVSVGVLDAGEITAKVIGSPKPMRTRENTVIPGAAKPFDNDTLFQACSISKSITALAVIKLCQEGKLNLDSPISQYLTPQQLSWIATPETRALVSQITLRLLLSHTSGLTLHGYSGYSTTHIPSIQQILTGSPPANNEPIRLSIFPGQKFSYSGGGFTVIQLILENHLEKPFSQVMDEIVLQPLKMTRSSFQILSAIEKNYGPAYLTGKQKSDPDHHLLPESAAAGLWTTPSDLLRAVQAIQWSLESDDFLETRWAETMLAEVKENGMALGWKSKKNGISFDHVGGNDPGYRCFVLGYADLNSSDEIPRDGDESMEERMRNVPKDCGICIMTSSALGERTWAKILAGVLYLKAWPSPFIQGWPNLLQTFVPFMDRSRKVDEKANEWCGQWGPGGWSLVDEGGLFLRIGNLLPVKLLQAAIPPHNYIEGRSIDLVADGLEMMLRLGWKDGMQIVEVWQDGEIMTLERDQVGDGRRSSSMTI